MSQRIEKVIDSIVRSGRRKITIPIPKDSIEAQVVLDRTRFEDLIAGDKEVCTVELHADQTSIGLIGWAGGRSELIGNRPGQRHIWSIGRWYLNIVMDEGGNLIYLPTKAKTLKITINCNADFDCLLDVDFF